MTASSYRLDQKTAEDDAICERLAALGPIMRERAIEWARINTGSWNRAGLDTLAPQLAAAFEQLDADITLDESGALFLQTSVLGNNPDYENGRQVKLNLTLENNLLSLLKSLQTIESVNLWVTRKFEQQH